MNEKYITWLEKANVIDTIRVKMSYSRKRINNQCIHPGTKET